MDPNVTLKDIRDLIAIDRAQPEGLEGYQAERLLELVAGLDEWLSRGGFQPAAWRVVRPCDCKYPSATVATR